MKVSFLIPTRQRLEMVLNAIKSIKEKASPDVQLEFLVRIDDDDFETLAGRERISNYASIIIGPRWCGYDCIYMFYNELAAKSHGDWLILWNDDLFMVTQEWDRLLPSILDRPQIVWLHSPTSWTWAFPAMSRKLYELWGCFVPSLPIDKPIITHNINNADSRIFDIWRAAGKPIPDPEDHSNQILVEHRRNEDNIHSIDIRQENKIFPQPNPVDRDYVKLLRESNN